MPKTNAVGTQIQPGPRLIDGSDILGILSGSVNFSSISMGNGSVATPSLLYESSTDNITALAAGTQAGATQLYSEINRITVAAGNGASVMLPPSAPGLTVVVQNHSGYSIQVYGFAGSFGALAQDHSAWF